jgi:DNA-binding MarR family transcriptional regulator
MDTTIGNSPEQKYQTLLNDVRQMNGEDHTSVEAYLTFLRVARDVFAALQSYLGSYELSEGKLTVLMLLRESPDYSLSPSELAEKAGVTRGTITGFLDGLERARLIEREDHPGDRRMLTISLTTRGLDLLNQVMPDHIRRIKAFMANLNETERQQLLALLTKLDTGVPTLRRIS